MALEKICYYCGERATTREHVPPKGFFPRKANLQLKTVPSCTKHNNAKSHDDQYLLAQICIYAGAGDNLPKRIFLNSIKPQLEFSEKFHRMIIEGAECLPSGAIAYQVNIKRFDQFFDSLSRALYFDRYGRPLDSSEYHISHFYLSLRTEDQEYVALGEYMKNWMKYFFEQAEWSVTHYEAAKLSEVVYQHSMIDPTKGGLGSVTIAHTFYGIFNVLSLLTHKPSIGITGESG
jgi:hypothetical protein